MNTGDKSTHRVAVALRYEHGLDSIPVVVAKGHGGMAERIIALAEESGVEIRNDPDLSNALSQLEVDQKIPPELFKVVAEIIGFVLRKRNKPPT